MDKFKKIGVALAFVPALALADLDYTFVEGNFGNLDVDGAGDGSLIGFKGSYAIKDMWFTDFVYQQADVSGLDATGYTLSFGWHGQNVFVKFGFESQDFDVADDTGYTFDVGARGMVAEKFELNGHVGMSDIGDLETYTNYGFGAVYTFAETWGATFNYDLRSGDFTDLTTWSFGVRKTF